MSEASIAEYIDLCSQLASVAPDEVAEQRLYNRLDRLWYVEMSSSERIAAERMLAAKADSLAWHVARCTERS